MLAGEALQKTNSVVRRTEMNCILEHHQIINFLSNTLMSDVPISVLGWCVELDTAFKLQLILNHVIII